MKDKSSGVNDAVKAMKKSDMKITYISKNFFDYVYQEQLKKLSKVTPDSDHDKSPYYQQQAFTENEQSWHFRSTFFVFCIVFYGIGLKLGFLAWCIKNLPFPFVDIIGHGPKCIMISLGVVQASFIVAVYVKLFFFRIVAWLHGYQILFASDDIYLYDLPVNPVNIPGCLVFKKEKGEKVDATHMAQVLLERYLGTHQRRNFVKIVKKWGKYFMCKQTEAELKESLQTHYGVVEDIHSEEEAIEFQIKLKLIATHNDGDMPQHFYILPNYSETEIALICINPHLFQDGTSMLQAIYLFMDEQDKDDYYPFLKVKNVSIFQWVFMYLTFPYYCYLALKHWYSRKEDKNCIKQHGNYLTGQCRMRNSLVMSTSKAKNLAKSTGNTFNELIMAIISTSLKEYFVAHKDETTNVTVSVPFSFRTIPTKKIDYRYGNAFASMCLYLNLESKFEDALKMARKVSNEQIRRFPGALYILTKIEVTFFSIKGLCSVLKTYGKKHSFVLSNVPGFMEPLHLCGYQLKRLYMIATGPGTCATGFFLFSVMDQVQFSITTDEAQIKDLDSLLAIINRKIQEHGIAHEGKENKD